MPETAPAAASPTDNPALPEVWIEGDIVGEWQSDLQFTIHLTQAAVSPVTVTVQTYDGFGTAEAGLDYSARATTVTVLPGRASATFNVPVRADTRFEPTELVFVYAVSASGAVIGDYAIDWGAIVDDDNPGLALPTDDWAHFQWHLYPGSGANVLPVWTDYTGRGITVAVFDNGIDRTQPDLDGSLSTAFGRDTDTLAKGGDPRSAQDNHGTAVAGVIAAERNGDGVVGVAYNADLISLYQTYGDASGNEIVNAFAYAQDFDILNNSWGFAPQSEAYALNAPWAFADNFRGAFAAEGRALQLLAENGRDGLGTIVVQSAGNSFAFGDDTNLHNFQNSRYIITVGATDYLGNSTDYSSPGASVLVSAPGGGGQTGLSYIWTTDRSGVNGYSSDELATITGTSFSAPLVSGIVALMLEANPGLGYRDVQQILAYSSRTTGRDQNTWEFNGAKGWNGGGLHFDALTHDIGFGLVDAQAAVRLAESWRGPAATSANDVEVRASVTQPAAIPDGSSLLQQSVSITQAIEVERVEVTVDIDHGFIGDLALLLTSPAGTDSWLLWRPGQGSLSAVGLSQDDIDFTFDTVLSLGESSLGTWRLSVFDMAPGDAGRLNNWSINLVGKAADADDLYIYTDEFSDARAAESARGTLRDSGGVDTINAAAVTTAVNINLVPGRTSTIDGQTLTIDASTQIENAFGGDAPDTLNGNPARNRLFGGRGGDTINGAAGDDVIGGGPGGDILDGGDGTDTAVFDGRFRDHSVVQGSRGWVVTDRNGTGGRDTVNNFERLQWDDYAIAYDLGGRAGDVAEIIRGLFGPAFLTEELYVGLGLQLFDQGLSYEQIVGLAIGTPLFASLAGSRSNTAFIELIWHNVLGGRPGAADLAYYGSLLDSGALTQASLGTAACQYVTNASSVEILALATLGIEYTPYEG